MLAPAGSPLTRETPCSVGESNVCRSSTAPVVVSDAVTLSWQPLNCGSSVSTNLSNGGPPHPMARSVTEPSRSGSVVRIATSGQSLNWWEPSKTKVAPLATGSRGGRYPSKRKCETSCDSHPASMSSPRHHLTPATPQVVSSTYGSSAVDLATSASTVAVISSPPKRFGSRAPNSAYLSQPQARRMSPQSLASHHSLAWKLSQFVGGQGSTGGGGGDGGGLGE